MAIVLPGVSSGGGCCACSPEISPCNCDNGCFLVCRSKTGTAQVCGFAEFTDPSDPPKFYKRMTLDGCLVVCTYGVQTGECLAPAPDPFFLSGARASSHGGSSLFLEFSVVSLPQTNDTHGRLRITLTWTLTGTMPAGFNAYVRCTKVSGGGTLTPGIDGPVIGSGGASLDWTGELNDTVIVRFAAQHVSAGDTLGESANEEVQFRAYMPASSVRTCFSGENVYDPDDDCTLTVGGIKTFSNEDTCSPPEEPESTEDEIASIGGPPVGAHEEATRTERYIVPDETGGGCVDDGEGHDRIVSGSIKEELSDEDTEQDAIDRANEDIEEWTGGGCADGPAFMSVRAAAQTEFLYRHVQVQAKWTAIIGHSYEITVRYSRRLLLSGGPYIFFGVDQAIVTADAIAEESAWFDVPNEPGWETIAEGCEVVDITL